MANLHGIVDCFQGCATPQLLVVFIAGVFVMRAAGCILNDMADRSFDPYVTRTQSRPLATGQLSMIDALCCLTVLLAVALLLLLTLNALCFKLAIVAVAMAVVYPLAKRWIPCPQVVLGFVFNGGILMAFAAVTDRVSWVAFWLYLIAMLWTVAYDTLYSVIDKDDDQALGLNSLAILLGEHVVLVVRWLYVAIVAMLLLLGPIAGLTGWYYLSVMAVAAHFGWQSWRIKDLDPNECFSVFLSNHWAWLMIFIGCFLSYSA